MKTESRKSEKVGDTDDFKAYQKAVRKFEGSFKSHKIDKMYKYVYQVEKYFNILDEKKDPNFKSA
jgi:hypothetical protein